MSSLRNWKIYFTTLTIFVIFVPQSGFSQNPYIYGYAWTYQALVIDGKRKNCAIVNSVRTHFPAEKAGLHSGDVIFAVDGQPVTDVNMSGAGSKVTLSVKRLGNQHITLVMYGIPCSSRSKNIHIPETFYAQRDITSQVTFYATEKTLDIEPVNIMYDPDADFYQYKSFDFEFTGQTIMQQREMAPELELMLTRKGLIRDQKNPDLLVFIELYSDRREQYVPPTQAITTRYNTAYNVWTKQHETRQYVESHQ
jgi:hypothetical protein